MQILKKKAKILEGDNGLLMINLNSKLWTTAIFWRPIINLHEKKSLKASVNIQLLQSKMSKQIQVKHLVILT